MNALPISVTLIIAGIAVGLWHGLKWLFGWDGIGLGIATLVLTGVIYQGTEALLELITSRRLKKQPPDGGTS